MSIIPRAARCALFAATAGGIAYTAIAIAQVRRFRNRPRLPDNAALGVSVLKPLAGDEPGLRENLRSFCDQTYRNYQVVFGAADARDPALRIARELQSEYSQVAIDIVSGRAVRARNRKIGNVLGMIDAARHPIVAIADSDIRVGPSYAASIAAAFAHERVGAATCLYGARPVHRGVFSRLGAMFVNEQFAPSVLVGRLLEPLTYCFGASMAVRVDVLQSIGGIEALADELGDDYRLGHLVARAGFKVALCDQIVETAVAERSLRALLQREVRWARTIRLVRPLGFAGSVLTTGLPLPALFVAATRANGVSLLLFGLAAVLRICLQSEARKTFAPGRRAELGLIPVRDCLSLWVWCAGFSGRRVVWRRDRLRVDAAGRLVCDPIDCKDSV